jgi:hypothetical protein
MRAGMLRRVPPRLGHTGQARLIMAGAATAGLLTLMAAPAAAATNPYAGQSGYDASYPSAQCAAASYPAGFAIIGLGGGRPFTTSSCLAHEWSASIAAPSRSLYFNTGYAGAYAKQITTGCTSAVGNAPIPPSTPPHQKSTEQQAWEIGCSEAAYAAAQAPGEPAMWWADVETGNSWSTNTAYNDLAIDGIAYKMSILPATSPGGGIYSTPAMWNKIAGPNFVLTPGVTADWQPASACPASGFTGSPVWLIQNGTITNNNGTAFSADTGCYST